MKRLPDELWFKVIPEEVEYFWGLMARHHLWTFWHPNWDHAPWHVKAQLTDGQGPVVNIWPHTMKHNIEGEPRGADLEADLKKIEGKFYGNSPNENHQAERSVPPQSGADTIPF